MKIFTRLFTTGCLILFILVSFALFSCSNPTESEKRTEYFVYVGNGYPENKIYKIDATTDLLVDSLEITDIATKYTCSLDGRELWAVGPEQTLIINTADMSIKRRLSGFSYFEPLFIENSDEILCIGHERIFYLNSSDFSIAYEDSSIGFECWPEALVDRASHIVGGRDPRKNTWIQNRYFFYDYVNRTLVDSIELTRLDGQPAQTSVIYSSDRSVLYGVEYVPWLEWSVFDPKTGREIAKHGVECSGYFTFVNAGKEVVIASPHDCRERWGCDALVKYNVLTYERTGEISLFDFSDQDSVVRIASGFGDGVEVPGYNKMYICEKSGCFPEAVYVVDVEPFHFRKSFFKTTNQYFSYIVVGRKP